ncbi:MAG: hypothetical protein WKF68_08615 [Daejeonella sp.]
MTAAFSYSLLCIAGIKPSKKPHITATMEMGQRSDPKHNKMNITIFKISVSKEVASIRLSAMGSK